MSTPQYQLKIRNTTVESFSFHFSYEKARAIDSLLETMAKPNCPPSLELPKILRDQSTKQAILKYVDGILGEASMKGLMKIVKALAESDPQIVDYKGLLSSAALYGHDNVFEYLLTMLIQHKDETEQYYELQDRNKNTTSSVLMIVIGSKRKKMLELLLKSLSPKIIAAMLNMPNATSYHTPLLTALSADHSTIKFSMALTLLQQDYIDVSKEVAVEFEDASTNMSALSYVFLLPMQMLLSKEVQEVIVAILRRMSPHEEINHKHFQKALFLNIRENKNDDRLNIIAQLLKWEPNLGALAVSQTFLGDKFTPGFFLLIHLISNNQKKLVHLLLDYIQKQTKEFRVSVLNAVDMNGRTPLISAIERMKCGETIKRLIQLGADPNGVEQGCQLPILVSVGSIDIVLQLIQANANVRVKGKPENFGCERAGVHTTYTVRGLNLIQALVIRGTQEEEEKLIELLKNLVENHKLDVNETDLDNNCPPLHIASSKNLIKTTLLLLKLGANVNHQSAEGYSALMEVRSKEMIKLLISYDADVNLTTKEGIPAVGLLAKYHRDPEVLELLIKKGLNLKVFFQGKSLLEYLCEIGNLPWVSFLVNEYKTDPFLDGEREGQPNIGVLKAALLHNQLKVLDFLFEQSSLKTLHLEVLLSEILNLNINEQTFLYCLNKIKAKCPSFILRMLKTAVELSSTAYLNILMKYYIQFLCEGYRAQFPEETFLVDEACIKRFCDFLINNCDTLSFAEDLCYGFDDQNFAINVDNIKAILIGIHKQGSSLSDDKLILTCKAATKLVQQKQAQRARLERKQETEDQHRAKMRMQHTLFKYDLTALGSACQKIFQWLAQESICENVQAEEDKIFNASLKSLKEKTEKLKETLQKEMGCLNEIQKKYEVKEQASSENKLSNDVIQSDMKEYQARFIAASTHYQLLQQLWDEFAREKYDLEKRKYRAALLLEQIKHQDNVQQQRSQKTADQEYKETKDESKDRKDAKEVKDSKDVKELKEQRENTGKQAQNSSSTGTTSTAELDEAKPLRQDSELLALDPQKLRARLEKLKAELDAIADQTTNKGLKQLTANYSFAPAVKRSEMTIFAVTQLDCIESKEQLLQLLEHLLKLQHKYKQAKQVFIKIVFMGIMGRLMEVYKNFYQNRVFNTEMARSLRDIIFHAPFLQIVTNPKIQFTDIAPILHEYLSGNKEAGNKLFALLQDMMKISTLRSGKLETLKLQLTAEKQFLAQVKKFCFAEASNKPVDAFLLEMVGLACARVGAVLKDLQMISNKSGKYFTFTEEENEIRALGRKYRHNLAGWEKELAQYMQTWPEKPAVASDASTSANASATASATTSTATTSVAAKKERKAR